MTEVHTVDSLDEFIPAQGRSVVYQIAPGEWRPAQVVKTWGRACCNLVVFLDGPNDNMYRADNWAFPNADNSSLTGWVTSRTMGLQVGQWAPRVPVSLD